MVLGAGLVKRATKIGTRNPYVLGAFALAAVLLLSKRGQSVARGGIPLVSQAGEAIGTTIESILPLDIFGRELSAVGTGFGEFGVGIGSGISGIFAPITNFINWATSTLGIGNLSASGGAGGSGKALGDPASAQAQEEETVI